MQSITIKSTKKREALNVTRVVNDLLSKNYYDKGILLLFCTHTTCAITTADLDEGGTDLDYLDVFEKIIPPINFRHPHDPAHMPDHILSSIIGCSLLIPVQSASMVLGTWQKLVLFEFDGPAERRITLTFIPEPKK